MYSLQYVGLIFWGGLVCVTAAPAPQGTLPTSTVYTSVIAPTISDTATTTVVTPSSTATAADQQACNKIAGIVGGRNISQGITVPAALAWDCLQSVPLDVDSAILWLESIKPYIQWQTTLAYLANPPENYTQPPVDINAGLEKIIADTKGGKYSNEYSLEFDVYHLIQRAHDGHFRYVPNLVGNVVTFGRTVALVSVMTDDSNGLQKQYVYDDVLLSSTITGFEPSAITHIDGVDVVMYLEDWSQTGSSQDPDALWNLLFFSLPASTLASIQYTSGSGLFVGADLAAHDYPGSHTTLKFENGTTTVYENFARVLQSFGNITNGSDIFKQYVAPTTTSTYSFSTLPTVTKFPGYPTPLVIQANGLDSGYYLDAEGYEDVAVLSIPTFEAVELLFTNAPGLDFRDAAFDFIDQAKADGKTKLIIDVSGNGGGEILQGYSFFLKLFPDLFPYLGQRIRATESVNIIGQTLSATLNDPGFNIRNSSQYLRVSLLLQTPMDYQIDLDVNNQTFPSWPAEFGPHTYHGDNFSSIIRYNTSSSVFRVNYTNIGPTRPFAPENIILLTDGNCASTCSIFSELLTRQGGVKTVTVGGRPNKNPMQALGATKGSNNIGWINAFLYVNETRGLFPADQQAAFNATVLGKYNEIPFYRGSTGSLNFRDQLREGDETQTPLQFVYEAADCRIAKTMPMVVDITATWKEVYDVAWNGKECLAGEVQSGVKRNTKRDMYDSLKEMMPTLSDQQAFLLRKSSEAWSHPGASNILGTIRSSHQPLSWIR